MTCYCCNVVFRRCVLLHIPARLFASVSLLLSTGSHLPFFLSLLACSNLIQFVRICLITLCMYLATWLVLCAYALRWLVCWHVHMFVSLCMCMCSFLSGHQVCVLRCQCDVPRSHPSQRTYGNRARKRSACSHLCRRKRICHGCWRYHHVISGGVSKQNNSSSKKHEGRKKANTLAATKQTASDLTYCLAVVLAFLQCHRGFGLAADAPCPRPIFLCVYV